MIQTRHFCVALALLLFGGIFHTVFAQPSRINSVEIISSQTTFCEDSAMVNAQVDFLANIDTERDTVFEQGFPPTSNFQAQFQHTFRTESRCLYAMRITGSYSVWSNTTQLADARYRFDPNTNALLNQADPPGMNITPPDFFAPADYNPNHEYWYFYQGNGRDISFDFSESGGYADNSGDMTFDWFVIPCYDTLWTIDGISFPGGNGRSFSWQSEGNFDVSLLITDVLNDSMKMATDQIKVNVRPKMNLETIAACGQGETGSAEAFISQNTGSMPFRFSWSDGSPDAAFAENLPAGNYQITVIDAENCRDTVDFSIIEKSAPMLLLETTDPTCEGLENGLIELMNPETGWEYSINGNDFQFTPLFQSLGVGDYDFYINDGDGCIFSETTTLTAPSVFSVDLPVELVVNSGDPFTLDPTINGTGNFSYNWLPFEDLDCPDCANPSGTLTTSQDFTLTVLDDAGCSAQASIFVRVVIPEPVFEDEIFIPSAFSPNNDGINDFLTVFVDQNKVVQISNLSVFDRYGGLIFQRKDFEPNDESLGWNGEHSGKPLDSGIYAWFAELERADGSKAVVKGDVSLLR